MGGGGHDKAVQQLHSEQHEGCHCWLYMVWTFQVPMAIIGERPAWWQDFRWGYVVGNLEFHGYDCVRGT